MAEKFNEDEIWEIIGYIKISQTRYITLKTLNTHYLMPSEIAKSTGLKTTQISQALSQLKKKDLVKCVNESAYKGRIYQSTDLGLEVLDKINEFSLK